MTLRQFIPAVTHVGKKQCKCHKGHWTSMQLTKSFFVTVCWVNSAPVISVPYTTALEAIGYFLNSAFTAVDTLLTMDMLLAMSTWNYMKFYVGLWQWCFRSQNRAVAVLCPLSNVKIQKLRTVFQKSVCQRIKFSSNLAGWTQYLPCHLFCLMA